MSKSCLNDHILFNRLQCSISYIHRSWITTTRLFIILPHLIQNLTTHLTKYCTMPPVPMT